MEWVIYTSWQVDSRAPAAETSNAFPDWSTARRQALHLTCCRGARYVTVCGPGSIVVADWDRYTNLWREYNRRFSGDYVSRLDDPLSPG